MARLTQIHDVISADGAVVDDNVPCPQGDGVPFLHLEALLVIEGLAGLAGNAGLLLHNGTRRRCVSHVDVGHFVYSGEGGDGWNADMSVYYYLES